MKTPSIVFKQAYERADGRCENPDCLKPYGDWRGLAAHHKIHKGMGGSSNPAVHSLENIIILCGKCHAAEHGIKEI